MIKDKANKITNIATKRGFFFPTAEIYGAKAGFWTYGHIGKLMKNKLENIWRSYFLNLNPNYYEIEGNSILPKQVFKASGHLEKFDDVLAECSKCNSRYKAEEIIEEQLNKIVTNSAEIKKIIKSKKVKCPKCNSIIDKVRSFNMMFDVKLGVKGEEIAFLTPETAQNPFISFKREFFALREKLPLGLAMIGKAFRNEISPRQGFFRLREFTQAELQIFFNPDNLNESENWNDVKNYKLNLFLLKNKKTSKISCNDANKKSKLPRFYVYHLAKIQKFYLDVLKIPSKKLRIREVPESERAFYNKIHFDFEIDLETLGGWKEVAGCHLRGSYDLSRHQYLSGEKLEIVSENKRFIPNTLELSFGIDRNMWSLMDIFYDEEKERNLFRFPNNIAPFNLAVFPLVNKDGLPEKATEVYNLLKNDFKTLFDSKSSIGRMYRRVDEIGCPYMITIDYNSLKKKDVTIRERDSMKQIRVKIKDLTNILHSLVNGEKLSKFGKFIN